MTQASELLTDQEFYAEPIKDTLEWLGDSKSQYDFDEWARNDFGKLKIYAERHIWGSMPSGFTLSEWGGRLSFLQWMASEGLVDIKNKNGVIYYYKGCGNVSK